MVSRAASAGQGRELERSCGHRAGVFGRPNTRSSRGRIMLLIEAIPGYLLPTSFDLKGNGMAKIERNNEELKDVLMPPVFRVQLVREKSGSRTGIAGPESVAEVLGRYLQFADREHFVALMLDVKNRIIGIHAVSVGTLFCALVSPREVFKAAILANAAAIVVAHNHPSGDVTPSPEDIQVSKTLREAGRLLDIEVLDHVIVGGDGAWTSLKQMGHM